jgi:NMD protein affecting ribosome stability and mRNA decay
MIKKFINLLSGSFCRICGRHCGSIGSGESINGMCERCYENGGDDE